MAGGKQKQTAVITSNDVHRGHLHGAGLATHLANKRAGKGGGKTKKGKAKIKVQKPPVGGWKF